MCEGCADEEERKALFGKTFVTVTCGRVDVGTFTTVRTCRKGFPENGHTWHTKVTFRKEKTEIDAINKIKIINIYIHNIHGTWRNNNTGIDALMCCHVGVWPRYRLPVTQTRVVAQLEYHGPGAPPARQSRLYSTASSTPTLNTLSPSMSYLEPSASSFKYKERIGQGAMSGESQQQRYASFSCLCLSALWVNLAIVHILRHRSTSLTMTHFSTFFISIGHFF